MTPLEVLTVGRVSVDLYAEQPHASMTEVRTFRKSVGGTATNVAVAAARLGHRAAVATRVGDDAFGRYIRHALAETFGVDARFVSTHPELKTPLAFALLDPPENPTLIFYRQPRAPDLDLEATPELEAAVDEAAVFWVPASRFSAEPSRTTVLSLLARRARRAHTVLDLDWRPMFWASQAEARAQISPVLNCVNVALGNRTECEVAVGSAVPDEAADRLLERGLDAAIIKLGSDGVLVALSNGTRHRIAPCPVEVVCGLGAGDAFGGALCHGLLSGWGWVKAVRYANAAGAIVAARMMCADAMPTLDEIEHFLSERASWPSIPSRENHQPERGGTQ